MTVADVPKLPEMGRFFERIRPKALRPEDAAFEEYFWREMAKGECLCGEIDAGDRPCLTCQGQLRTTPPAANDTRGWRKEPKR